MTEENDNGKLAKKRFVLKSGLAVASLAAMIGLTLVLWFLVPIERLKIIMDTSFYLYFAFTSIAGAAVGFESWSTKKK